MYFESPIVVTTDCISIFHLDALEKHYEKEPAFYYFDLIWFDSTIYHLILYVQFKYVDFMLKQLQINHNFFIIMIMNLHEIVKFFMFNSISFSRHWEETELNRRRN